MDITETAILHLLGYEELQYNITRTSFDFVNENQIISPSALQQQNYERIIAIGSVFEDKYQLITAMHSMGICDINGTWIASNTVLIQNGDVSTDALNQIIEWSQDSLKYNSLCLMIMGEYESDVLDEHHADPVTVNAHVADLEQNMKHAVGAFLRNLPIIRVIGNTVFVHNGVSATVATEVYGDIRYLNALALLHYKYRVNIEHYVELIDDCLRNDEYLLDDEFTDREFRDEEQICVMLETTMNLIGNYLEFDVRNMVISTDGYNDDNADEKIVRCDNTVLYALKPMIYGQYWEQQRIRI